MIRMPVSARTGRLLLASGLILLQTISCTGAPGTASGATSAVPAAPATSAAGTSIARLDPGLDAVLARDARIELVAEGFQFVEGPVWTGTELWFSDLMANKLYAVGADGGARLLLDNSGGASGAPHSDYPGSNGAELDADGSILMAQHAARRIVRITRNLAITPVVERDAQGRRLNSPNDMVFGPDGALWFTDPPFGLAGFGDSPQKEIPYNGVYRWKDGQLRAAITDLPNPNGIAMSPDGRRLYISNSGPEMFINIYDVAPDGSLSNPRRLISFPGPRPDDVPDGMKVDSLGNIWASGPGGIRIITPEGKVLGQIKTPDLAQANLAWGGANRSTAYITAAGRVYRLAMKVPGLKPLYGR